MVSEGPHHAVDVFSYPFLYLSENIGKCPVHVIILCALLRVLLFKAHVVCIDLCERFSALLHSANHRHCRA